MDIYIQFRPHPPIIFCIHKRQDALHDTVRNLFCSRIYWMRYRFGIAQYMQTKSPVDSRKIEWDMLNVFVDQNAKKDDIVQTGEVFLFKLYGSTHCTSLEEHRYNLYMKQVSRKSLTSSAFKLVTLPPSPDSAKYH